MIRLWKGTSVVVESGVLIKPVVADLMIEGVNAEEAIDALETEPPMTVVSAPVASIKRSERVYEYMELLQSRGQRPVFQRWRDLVESTVEAPDHLSQSSKESAKSAEYEQETHEPGQQPASPREMELETELEQKKSLLLDMQNRCAMQQKAMTTQTAALNDLHKKMSTQSQDHEQKIRQKEDEVSELTSRLAAQEANSKEQVVVAVYEQRKNLRKLKHHWKTQIEQQEGLTSPSSWFA